MRKLLAIIITKTDLVLPRNLFLQRDRFRISYPESQYWVHVDRPKISDYTQNGQRTLLILFQPALCSERNVKDSSGEIDIIYKCNTAMNMYNMGIKTATKPSILSPKRDTHEDVYLEKQLTNVLGLFVYNDSEKTYDIYYEKKNISI